MPGSSEVTCLDSRRRRRRAWFFYAVINTSAVGAALLLAELFIGMAGWAPAVYRISFSWRSPYRLSANPVLGYEFKPNFRDPKSDGNLSYPYINSGGFRDIERRRKKPPGTKRIIMLGDSVIAGLCVPDLEQTVPRQLERLLGRSKLEVLNFGINGYCTRAEVELLRTRGIAYSPDLVILTFVHNDYAGFNNDLLAAEQERSGLSKFLFIHSGLFRVLCLRYNWFGYRQDAERADLLAHGRGLLVDFDPQSLESAEEVKGCLTLAKHLGAIGPNNVAEGLRLLKKMSRRHGFKVLVLVWPYFSETDIVDVESYNQPKPLPCTQGQRLVVEKSAEQAGLSCLRLAPQFHADLQQRRRAAGTTPLTSNPREIYAINREDDIHPSPEGARVAAEAIAELLTKHPELLP